MKKDEEIVLEYKFVIFGNSTSDGDFNYEGEGMTHIVPYKYTELEVNILLGMKALESFGELNMKSDRCVDIKELGVKVSNIERVKENGKRTSIIKRHLKM